MNLRTYKRRRITAYRRRWPPLSLMPALAEIRRQRRELLKNEKVRRDMNRMMEAARPRTRRMIRKFVAADLMNMREAGEWADLATFTEFLSPYARRVLDARLDRRTVARITAHARARMGELDAKQAGPE